MKYIQAINELIVKKTSETENLVLFGQNIAAGSCISGLTKGLKVGKGGRIINTPNVENTLTGVGFGMMLRGVSSVFFMKQQDFLLLGIDHLVNTYNFIRRKKPEASFTIFFVVSDLGYHGVQSSLNNFGDFCSIARIRGFAITSKVDAEEIISTYLVSPGFRIIGVSQRLFGQEIVTIPPLFIDKEKTIFQYAAGKDTTIVCFNLSFPYGVELQNKLVGKGIDASLFSVSAVTPVDWRRIVDDVLLTKKLVILDDSKSANSVSDNFLATVLAQCDIEKKIVIRREFERDEWLFPNADLLTVDSDAIARELL